VCRKPEQLCSDMSNAAIDGTLVRYGPKPPHVALLSPCIVPGDRKEKKVCVTVGGLSCGMLYAEYLRPLYEELQNLRYHMCQPLLSSSHASWGVGSVSQDAEELGMLFGFLQKEYNFSEVIILGHSTGCQDAVMYLRKYGNLERFKVTGVVLQGPVSDREFLTGFLPDITDKIDLCSTMVRQGRGEDIAFTFSEFGDVVPVTARRFLSLAEVGGEDDMFSSHDLDLNSAMMPLRGTPTLVLMSGADECQLPYGIVPEAIGRRIADAIGDSATLEVIDGGLHDLKGTETSGIAAKKVVDFIHRIQTRE
jgi:pimeloyl-ACP methyl ester carboxylesterase